MVSESDLSNDVPMGEDAVASEIHTPVEPDAPVPTKMSHITLPSTEEPGSPIDPHASFRTEPNPRADFVIPSSITPPPPSQMIPSEPNPDAQEACGDVVMGNAPIASGTASLLGSQRSHPFSPPATGGNAKRMRASAAIVGEYAVPTKAQIEAASTDELRAMLYECAADHSRMKMEVAHHKFQLNLVSLQAADDAERAAVEHEMAVREVETLRNEQNVRQARRDLNSAAESTHAKYLQLKLAYDDAMDEITDLCKKLKTAKKVIRQHQDEVSSLRECRSQLLTRIRENREHFNMLRSPGGLFHSALPPASYSQSSRQSQAFLQGRGVFRAVRTPLPRSASTQEPANQEPLAALLQALEKNSAPSTPVAPVRPSARTGPKHTRNVQSLSALPTTPMSRMPRGPDQPALLPSIDLVPQTEPPPRYPAKSPFANSDSRESTVSVPDNNDSEDLARRAMNSFMSRNGAAVGQGSLGSQQPSSSSAPSMPRSSAATLDAKTLMSQASQAASEMLRIEARSSQDRSEPVTERATMQLHAKILSPAPLPSVQSQAQALPPPLPLAHNHLPLPGQSQQMAASGASSAGLSVPEPMGAAAEKRKFSEGLRPDPLRDILASPLKKGRTDNGVGEGSRG
ncbi:hypothetical protein TD95_004616 [Thielaviopsis punctulata]|uniref:Uncharacterized protein n=1 Tax=Thielaviopsis punctulata TaxID=72032 RepID=A0A0F4ZKJ9_9PEZI|nr:hypothetical protein TD95_004616 [Thielaviopsis punctulata]